MDLKPLSAEDMITPHTNNIACEGKLICFLPRKKYDSIFFASFRFALKNSASFCSRTSFRFADYTVIDADCLLPSSAIAGYFIDEEGKFHNILDAEIPMLTGNDLDGVSDWVEECISQLNEIQFAGR